MKSVILLSLAAVAFGDLRMASQPKTGYKNLDRQATPFVKQYGLYMEPSAFDYAGLEAQRANAYDNFLRSNIDNEQDKRNFNTEAGKDMLPFRSFEAAATTASGTVQTKLTAAAGADEAGTITATPGTPYSVPLRWNNPHAAELEVNIWIMPKANELKKEIVVPVMKPTCSGEGRQNNVFDFVIPTDYDQLSLKVPGFKGCNAVGDCTLQVYAHSVESRTYAMGTPLIVKATMASGQAQPGQIRPAPQDPALDLAPLRDLCLPRNDPSANIASAVPQEARLISDVFNHAFQNSDFSPYSGQQPEAISRNLQASAILKMVSGNRGELGKALLKQANPAAAKLQAAIEAKAKNVVAKLEGITNKIIASIQNNAAAKTQDTTLSGGQQTINCFRCAEIGATLATRLTTNTYVPSFQIPAALVDQARAQVPAAYANLIGNDGVLRIYTTALDMMNGEFVKAAAVGLNYLGPAVKTSATTMEAPTQFIKVNAAGAKDGGIYATKMALANGANVNYQSIGTPVTKALLTSNLKAANIQAPPVAFVQALEADEPVFPDSRAEDPEWGRDMDGMESDSNCDSDGTFKDGQMCQIPANLFYMGADGNLQVSSEFLDSSYDLSHASTASTSVLAVVILSLTALFAL